MFFLGAGEHHAALHNPDYDFPDDLIAIGREFAPDLVVYDPYLFAAPLAARVIGSHAVLHMLGPLMDGAVAELAADAVSPIWREFQLEVPPAAGLGRGHDLRRGRASCGGRRRLAR